MNIKTAIKRASVAAGVALGLAGGSAQAIDVLPTCTVGVTCLQFGNFNVFSLPLLDLQAGGDGVPSPGDTYFVSSTFGAIKNETIVGINNGQSGAGNIAGAIDAAYNTPSANNINVFSTAITQDTPNQFANDAATTWDATVSTLLQQVGGTPLTAFFAFNETGSGTGLDTTDLLIWASVTLRAADGTVGPTFFLGGSTQPSVANPDATDPNWVYVHAGICTVGTSFVGFPDANGNCAVGTVRNQNNLGQNAAAFMVNSPALDAALATGQWATLSILWEMAFINGGGETAWIQAVNAVPSAVVPEPASLALLAIGLFGLAALRRRRD
jgi:hypothetical protein